MGGTCDFFIAGPRPDVRWGMTHYEKFFLALAINLMWVGDLLHRRREEDSSPSPPAAGQEAWVAEGRGWGGTNAPGPGGPADWR